jgi:hypothetical protein
VRLLGCFGGALEELEDWEPSLAGRDPRGPGPDSPNFLGECGGLAANRAAAEGFRELIAFGSMPEFESFEGDFNYARAELVLGEEVDLSSASRVELAEVVGSVVARLDEESLVRRALAGSAQVPAVCGETATATALGDAGGVAAILRD